MLATLTRSDLSTIARCPRKYWYSKVLGLPEGPSSKAMSEGTIIHRGLEEAYKTAQGLDYVLKDAGMPVRRDEELLATCEAAGLSAMGEMTDRGTYEYRGNEQTLSADTRELESRERITDAFAYFMQQSFLRSLLGKRVAFVEKDFSYKLGVTNRAEVEIDGKLDLVLQDTTTGVFEVWDHKTVGQVNQALRFLSLDVQMNTYENMACTALNTPNVEMVYNLIRRDRPPGYGTRSLRTKSGTLSKASTDPDDYLRQKRWSNNERERSYTQDVLERYAAEAFHLQTQGDPSGPNRVPIKSGGEACMTSCPYNSRCAAEMLGYAEPTFTPAVLEEVGDD